MAEKLFQFINRGVVLRLEPGSLLPGQLMRSTNIDSTKEGSVCPAPGSKRFNGDNGNIWLTPHTLAKLVRGKGDAFDPRYVGEQSNIWRVSGPYSTDILVSTGLGLAANPAARWEAAPYNAGSSGSPYMYFAHPVRNLKDDANFTPLRRWGIPPPVRPCSMATNGTGLTGTYQYLYTYRNPSTGAEGNPCVIVPGIALTNQGARITFWGTDGTSPNGDPALTGLGSIAIYRAGGPTFGDNFYRFIGYGINPGSSAGIPLSDDFDDNTPDTELINARTIEFDNDMPVSSDLPIPFVGAVASVSSAGAYKKIFLKDYPGFGASDPPMANFFSIWSRVSIGDGVNQEDCIVFAVGPTSAHPVSDANNWIEVFCLNAHVADEQVSAGAMAGRACDLICQYQDAILLAGDTNNPHKVYRSKSGRPDAFPVIDLEDGNAHVLNVGSPSNPVMGITEYQGEVVCLNQQAIFVFVVLNGAMSPPLKTPSDRGMVAKHCYCRVKNEIWFLSYDGIYSWSGGEATLRTEAIRDVFNSYSTTIADQTYFQIDYTQLNAFHMECFEQEVWISYIDVNGGFVTWRYQILYDRWLPRILTSASPLGAVFGAFLAEKDTGRLIAGVQDNAVINGATGNPGTGFLQQMNIGTSDGWTVAENDGAEIEWTLQTGYEFPEEKTRLAQLTELVIEISNPAMGAGDFVNFNISYDYGATLDPVDAFGVTQFTAGNRRFLAFPLQQSGSDGAATGKEARSISLIVFGKTRNHVEIYCWTIRYNPLQIPTRNSILDWQDLGTKNDKQLYVLDLEFDPRGQVITMFLDVIAGYPGAQVPGIQAITLQPAILTLLNGTIVAGDPAMLLIGGTGAGDVVQGTVLQIDQELVYCATGGANPTIVRGYLGTTPAGHLTGSTVYSLGRVKQTIPIVDNVIAKAVRLRPQVPTNEFEIFSWAFDPKEDYPPDIVYFSPLTDNGSPFLKYINQIILDVDTNGQHVDVQLECDGAVVFTFGITTDRFTRYTNITCPANITGVNLRVLPRQPMLAQAKFQLWSVQYRTEPADRGPVTHTYDWDKLGTDNDKQLRTISFEYDGSAGDIQIAIDELRGLGGGQIIPEASVFTLLSNARGNQTFPFPDGHIAKMIRVYPKGPVPVEFKSWAYTVDKIDYPADYVLWTDPTDNGSPFVKYVNQIVLEVDTNGIPVEVLVELDGLVGFTFQVTATRLTRRQQVVCPPQLSGINMRIIVPWPLLAGAKFQMWSVSFVTEPADRAAVSHSYDWDRIGHAYDKKLKSIAFEYDGSAGDVDMKMETLLGINGVTVGVPLIFRLLGSTRALQQFGIPDGNVVKMVRLSPVNAPALEFKSWKYDIEKENYPADYVLWTEKNIFGYACEKIARNLELDIDTGGVEASVDLFADGQLMQGAIKITTTSNDRSRIIALNSNLIGREWYLHLSPGQGGKTQLFSWNVDTVREPCAVTRVDTYESRLGVLGFKVIKQIWIAYQSQDTLTLSIYIDGGFLFFQTILPPHFFRDEERFYLPAVGFLPGDNGPIPILNKSKTFRIVIEAASGTFKLYADSVVEFSPIGVGQRLQQFLLTAREMQPVA